MTMDKIRFFELVTEWFEVLGVVAMVLGFVFAFVIAVRAWSRTRDGSSAFRTLRETMGAVILLGLEILVAADLVKTVTSSPSPSSWQITRRSPRPSRPVPPASRSGSR